MKNKRNASQPICGDQCPDGKLVKRYQVNAGKITRIYCGKSKSTYYLTSCRNGRQERELYRNRFDAEDKKKELEKI